MGKPKPGWPGNGCRCLAQGLPRASSGGGVSIKLRKRQAAQSFDASNVRAHPLRDYDGHVQRARPDQSFNRNDVESYVCTLKWMGPR